MSNPQRFDTENDSGNALVRLSTNTHGALKLPVQNANDSANFDHSLLLHLALVLLSTLQALCINLSSTIVLDM